MILLQFVKFIHGLWFFVFSMSYVTGAVLGFRSHNNFKLLGFHFFFDSGKAEDLGFEIVGAAYFPDGVERQIVCAWAWYIFGSVLPFGFAHEADISGEMCTQRFLISWWCRSHSLLGLGLGLVGWPTWMYLCVIVQM